VILPLDLGIYFIYVYSFLAFTLLHVLFLLFCFSLCHKPEVRVMTKGFEIKTKKLVIMFLKHIVEHQMPNN